MYRFRTIAFALLILTSCSKSNVNEPDPPTPPRVTETTVTGVTNESAYCNTTIFNSGGVILKAVGFCWSESINPTIKDDTTNNGVAAGFIVANIKLRKPNTLYHVRAYATTNTETLYGLEETFTTAPANTPPVLYLTLITSFTDVSIMAGGTIISDGGAPVTARGICWSKSPNPTIANTKSVEGNGIGTFYSAIEGLSVNITYHVRSYATNKVGTTYGEDQAVTTAYFIGQKKGGGKIFYIDETKIHGLIAAERDATTGIKWDEHSSIKQTKATSNTNGAANTTTIINVIGSGSNAATTCGASSESGFTDWYLPAATQLHLLFVQKNKIGTFSTNYEYWSSTESSDYFINAYSINFITGESKPRAKNMILLTRPIRNF